MRLPICYLVIVLPAFACNSPKPEQGAPDSSGTSEPPAPAATATAAPPPAPADLNTTALLKRMGCPKHERRGACEVVQGFETAGALHWKRPAGKARWVGYLYSVEKGRETRDVVILHARELPTAQASPGALPLRVGTGGFPEDLMSHAERMVSARSRRSGPSPRNLAPRFVSDFEPTRDFSVVQTDGASILTVEADPAYIREHDKNIYYVKPDETSPIHPSDGTYAALWLATW